MRVVVPIVEDAVDSDINALACHVTSQTVQSTRLVRISSTAILRDTTEVVLGNLTTRIPLKICILMMRIGMSRKLRLSYRFLHVGRAFLHSKMQVQKPTRASSVTLKAA